jgi:3-oxoacyl-[acyl-carrier protein] reductase
MPDIWRSASTFKALGDFGAVISPPISRQSRRGRASWRRAAADPPGLGGEMRLKAKAAIVTGAGQGFGLGIAETFAREGARVACLDLNGKLADAAAAKIGAGAIGLTCDVSKKDQVEAAVKAAISAFGRIDCVVNNAGTTHRNRPMLEVDEAEFDRIFAVNVKSIFLMANALFPHFREKGGGVVINVGSTAALRPRPGLTVYNASKGAVHLMSKSMAVEFAPDNIRVCALAPVAGETPLLATFLGADTPERRAAFKATVPLGRFSTPQDVANAALFLASDEAAFLTGVVLEVDGGRCI